MYRASSDFHNAAASGADQKALLIFDDCVFTDMDIAVDVGIEFHDYFCTEDDIAIGQANSNEISFTLFNDDRLLNGYSFGDFTATLGVQIGTDTYEATGNTTIVVGSTRWVGNDTTPYLTRGSGAVSSQPEWPVKSLLCYDGKVYAFGSSTSQYKVYNTNGSEASDSVKNIVRNTAAKRWRGKGMYYHGNSSSSLDSTILDIWEGGTKKTYEFVPLGRFTAERPNQPDQIQLSMTCYDLMTRFDVDMPSPGTLEMSYPSTIKNLFEKMCAYVDVQYVTSTFMNSSATISEEPEDFSSVTMRDVLKWIAEAAGSNARFNRDGKLEMAWVNNSGPTYTESGYSEYNPYWYETRAITKLYNRDTGGGEDLIYPPNGSGNEGYLIQDNPLLKGVS